MESAHATINNVYFDFRKRKVYGRQISLFQSEMLGRGVYGEVCKAKCDGQPCAAKIFKIKISHHPNQSSSLHRLLEELSSTRHPNLVQYLGPYCHPEIQLPVLPMELCDENINTFLERSPGPLSNNLQLKISHDIALALLYLHSNSIVHGNLTGSNVLMVAGTQAKVTDFGFSEFSTVDLRLNSSRAPYMSTSALESAQITQSDDIFSFGVVIIQILTRQPPRPTSSFEQVYLPEFEQEVKVSVLETKRRQSHLQMIPYTHHLKPVAVQCLSVKECPSAEWLSEKLSELKRNSTKEQGSVVSQELQLVKQELDKQKRLTRAKSEEHLMQVQEKERTIDSLCGRIQVYEKTIEEQQRQMQENQQILEGKLQQYLTVIITRDRQIQENLKEIEAKNKILQENLHVIERLERELQQTKEHVQVLGSSLAQKDEVIEHLRDRIASQERVMQELKQHQQHTGLQQQQNQEEAGPMLTMPTTTWTEGQNAPENMYRGAAVVRQDSAFIRPVNSHTVYHYQNISGKEHWSMMPDNPNWNFGLAVIEGLLTSVGGSTKSLLSLVQADVGRWQWQPIFPPLPSRRSKVACVTTENTLVVAGGCADDKYLSTVEAMDIGTLHWTTVCPLPQPWSEISAVASYGDLYLAGGITDSGESQAVFSCTISDLLTSPTPRPLCRGSSVWKELCSLPVAQSTLASLSGHLLAIGGKNTSGKDTSEVYMYNPHTDMWSVLDQMKVTRSRCLVVTLPGECLVIIGGYTSSGTPTDSVEILQCSD